MGGNPLGGAMTFGTTNMALSQMGGNTIGFGGQSNYQNKAKKMELLQNHMRDSRKNMFGGMTNNVMENMLFAPQQNRPKNTTNFF